MKGHMIPAKPWMLLSGIWTLRIRTKRLKTTGCTCNLTTWWLLPAPGCRPVLAYPQAQLSGLPSRLRAPFWRVNWFVSFACSQIIFTHGEVRVPKALCHKGFCSSTSLSPSATWPFVFGSAAREVRGEGTVPRGLERNTRTIKRYFFLGGLASPSADPSSQSRTCSWWR